MDTYELPRNIQLGLQTLRETLENRKDPRSIERNRHAISLIYLESRLQTDTQTVTALRNDIEHVSALHASRDESLTALAHDLARLYQTHISPLGPKIIIEGDPEYLKLENCADMIRALLLAGIRAVVLWRQARGKRLACCWPFLDPQQYCHSETGRLVFGYHLKVVTCSTRLPDNCRP